MPMNLLSAFAAALQLAGAAATASWPDCNGTGEADMGPYGPSVFHNITWEGKIFYVLEPQGRSGPWPAVVYMHGWTGAWDQYAFPRGEAPSASTWYARPMDIYASHGMVVVFPFVIDPTADQKDTTKDADGHTIMGAIDFIKASQQDESLPLHGKIDADNLAIAGHSMGSGDVLRVGANLSSGLKFVASQHPAPYFMENLKEANKFPLLLVTSTNDEAFFPAPQTADNVANVWNKAQLDGPASFMQFSTAACVDSGKAQPWGDEGHCCSFKPNVETPWVLRGLKLYLQFDGDASSHCGSMFLGTDTDSLVNEPNADRAIACPAGVQNACQVPPPAPTPPTPTPPTPPGPVTALTGNFMGSVPQIIEISANFSGDGSVDLDLNIMIVGVRITCKSEAIVETASMVTYSNAVNKGDCWGDGIRTTDGLPGHDVSKYFLLKNADGSVDFHGDGTPVLTLYRPNSPWGSYFGAVPQIIEIWTNFTDAGGVDIDLNIMVAGIRITCKSEAFFENSTVLVYPNATNDGDCWGDGIRTSDGLPGHDVSKFFLVKNADGSLDFHGDGVPVLQLNLQRSKPAAKQAQLLI